MTTDPFAAIRKGIGGAPGVLLTGVSPKAFEQVLGFVRRGGTVSLTGLPPGDFPLPVFDVVRHKRARLDRQQPAGHAGNRSNSAGAGKVKATVAMEKLKNINHVIARMHRD